MDNCVFPMEIIDAICMCDYGNWTRLIRCCKAIYEALIGRRWEVKTAVKPAIITGVSLISDIHKATVQYINEHTREIIFVNKGDYWEVIRHSNFINGVLNGEAVSFNRGKVSYCNWYNSGNHVCGHEACLIKGSRYYAWQDRKWINLTRDKIKTILNNLELKYNWLNYLPHES